MPEPRKFLKFLPRPGANVHITIGEPLTAAIEPLVSEWRRLAAEQPAAVGVGGEWEHESKREARGKGIVADGREEAVRLRICNLLQDTLQAMGETRERAEGKFDRPQWTNSVAGRAPSIEK
jgi:monolysocardiolipin acyltransferase